MTSNTASILEGWTVRNMMQRNPVTVPSTMAVSVLAGLFEERQITGAPVVDAESEVVGVVSQSDLVREGSDSGTVADIMMPARLTVRPDTSLAGLARYLVNARVHRALVMEDEVLVGIITTFDVLHALADSEVALETE